MEAVLLGTGGFAPSGVRETACTLVRDGHRALMLDVGSGARRLLTDAALLDGVREFHALLTHFHLDHICGLPYLASLPARVTVWAPGAWLYRVDSAEILGPLRRPPLSPTDVTSAYEVRELREGSQDIAGFEVRTSAQPRHWAPTAGLRIDDHLALITDTPYETTSSSLAEGVMHLLHEAWSSSAAPLYPDRDATAADAARVASEAAVGQLTLIHLNPRLSDHAPLLEDARAHFDRVTLGEDNTTLATHGAPA